jgi:hypothetical protein
VEGGCIVKIVSYFNGLFKHHGLGARAFEVDQYGGSALGQCLGNVV